MEIDLYAKRMNVNKDVLLQTVNAQEDVESRLQRLKLETAVIEEHNERLELNKENASSKQTAEAVPDLEVGDC